MVQVQARQIRRSDSPSLASQRLCSPDPRLGIAWPEPFPAAQRLPHQNGAPRTDLGLFHGVLHNVVTTHAFWCIAHQFKKKSPTKFKYN
ncbi:MAG: hypothetical protein M0Z28_19480, partial [Rhodospirillales bacterium]|nr:hypothetical protein [Rhodospirillales bacterium]